MDGCTRPRTARTHRPDAASRSVQVMLREVGRPQTVEQGRFVPVILSIGPIKDIHAALVIRIGALLPDLTSFVLSAVCEVSA